MTQNTEYFIQIYKREGLGVPELERKKNEYAQGSFPHMAAVQCIAEIKETQNRMEHQREDARHTEAMTIARGANHIAKWAIVVSVFALIIAIIQAF